MKANLIIILLALPLFSLCQEKNYGMSVGLNLSKWSGADESFAQDLAAGMNYQDGFTGFNFNPKMRTGINLGFFLEYPVLKSATFQPEISYTEKGAKFSGSGFYNYYDSYYYYDNYDSYSVQMDMIYKSAYADLNLLVKYYFTNANTKPYILAGPGVGYLIFSKLDVSARVEGEADSDTMDLDLEEKLDANVNIGGGIDFSGLRLEYRYSKGLISIFDENSVGALKNSVSTINLVICF